MCKWRVSLLIAWAIIGVCCGTTDSQLIRDGGSNPPAAVSENEQPVLRVQNSHMSIDKGQAPRESMSPRWKMDIIDTTAGAEYLTESERQLIIEINMVRSDPKAYAHWFLEPLRPYYHRTLIERPGEITVSTHEGVRALDECIKALQQVKPAPPLTPKKGLTLGARDHARDQARTGDTGHTGSDGSTDDVRINRYGKWDITAGENIDYGNKEPRGIVTSLLIDDGVPSRGHRANLLNEGFKFVRRRHGATRGFSCQGKHPKCLCAVRANTAAQVF